MNSSLNPLAPEFYPGFNTFTQGCYAFINKSIRSSNNLPIEHQHDLLKTFNQFKNITTHIGENVFSISNKIISKEQTGKFKGNNGEENTENLISLNDSFVDRININIDNAMKKKTPDVAISTSPWWNQTPTVAKLEGGSTRLLAADNIRRPQITFKEAVDNSSSLWIPKLSHKPNSTRPLTLKVQYQNGVAIGYAHPYEEELKCFHPPEHSLTRCEDTQMPPGLSETPYTYIDSEAGLIDLVKHLNSVKEIAVDVEHHSYRTYQGITCLIQITTREGGDFIIDTLAAREHIYHLNESFTNPNIIKIFHGADSDVIWLQRDFGVYLVGLFDTHQAAKILNFPQLSLKYLLHWFCHVDVDKKYQRADWRIRPLPQELINYARMDTHYLLYVYDMMKMELLKRSDSNEGLLMTVFKNSVNVCLKTYRKPVISENSHIEVHNRFRKSFNFRQLTALKLLFKWRDEQARELDESVSYILPDHMMLSLAEKLPTEVQGITTICDPMPTYIKHNIYKIHKIVFSCRELPITPPYQVQCISMPTQPRRPQQVHDSSQTFHDSDAPLCMTADWAAKILNKDNIYHSDIYMFNDGDDEQVISSSIYTVNTDIKFFLSPFERYRRYRSLAQYEEMKALEEQKAKIVSRDTQNILTKEEVLGKIQQTNSKVENKSCIDVDCDKSHEFTPKRKRKMSNDDLNDMDSGKRKEIEMKRSSSFIKKNPYSNADFSKFYTPEKTSAHSKKKFMKKK